MHLICHFPNIVSGLYLIIVWHMCAHLSLKFAAILAYLAYPWKHGDKYVPQTRVTFFVTYVGISCCKKTFVNLTFCSLSWLFPRLFTYIWCCQRLNNLPDVHQVVLMPKIPVGRNCYSGRFRLIIGYGSIPCT
jgi:hypothetical protein